MPMAYDFIQPSFQWELYLQMNIDGMYCARGLSLFIELNL